MMVAGVGMCVGIAGAKSQPQEERLRFDAVSLDLSGVQGVPSQFKMDEQCRIAFQTAYGSGGNAREWVAAWINGTAFDAPACSRNFSDMVLGGISPETGIVVGYGDPVSPVNCVDPYAWSLQRSVIQWETQCPTIAETRAVQINDNFASVITTARDTVFLRMRNGTVTPLEESSQEVIVTGLNKDEFSCGSVLIGSPAEQRPALWAPDGSLAILPSRSASIALGLNGREEVIGKADVDGDPWFATSPAYWYFDNAVLLPTTSDYPYGSAEAINSQSMIAGTVRQATCCWGCEVDCSIDRAALWTRAGFDFLLSLLDEQDIRNFPKDGPLRQAISINDAGQLLVTNVNSDSRLDGVYLLTPFDLELSGPTPGIAGTVNSLIIAGLAPNQQVVLGYGRGAGAQPLGRDCEGGTLLIRDIVGFLGPVTADANGVAVFRGFVPASYAGLPFRLQAVDPTACTISHAIDVVFQ